MLVPTRACSTFYLASCWVVFAETIIRYPICDVVTVITANIFNQYHHHDLAPAKCFIEFGRSTAPCLQASATPAGRHPYGLATGALYIECVSVQSRLLLKECLRHFETESCQATGCGDGTNNKCRSMLCRMTRRLPSNIGNTRKEYQQSTQNLLARFLLVHIVFASDSLPTMSDTKLASSSSSSGTGQLSWGARLF